MTSSTNHKTQADKWRHYLNPLNVRAWLRPLLGKFLARIVAQGYQSIYSLTLGA